MWFGSGVSAPPREASELQSFEATAVAAMGSVDRAGGADQALHKIMG